MAPGKKEDILKEIRKDSTTKEIHTLMGEYDAVVVVECKLNDLQKILDRIRRLEFVDKTNTLISWEKVIKN